MAEVLGPDLGRVATIGGLEGHEAGGAPPQRVLALLLHRPLLGVHLGVQAHGPQGGRQPHGGVQLGVAAVPHHHQGPVGGQRAALLLQHGRHQAVDADAPAHAGEPLLGVHEGEVVVAPPRAHRAHAGGRQVRRLEHGAGVVVEAPGDGRIHGHGVVGDPGVGQQLPHRAQGGQPGRPHLAVAHQLGQRRQGGGVVLGPGGGQGQDPLGGVAGDVGLGQLGPHAVGPDLVDLVQGPQGGHRPVGQPQGVEQAVQHPTVVDAQLDVADLQRRQGGVEHGQDLGVGRRVLGADQIGIALHELPVPAPLGTLAPPDRTDLVAAERELQLAVVLGHEPGQRHGEVEAHAHVPAALVGEREHLAVLLLAPLAGQHLQVLEGRGGDGPEAERREGGPDAGQQGLPLLGHLGEQVPEPSQRAGLDDGAGGGGVGLGHGGPPDGWCRRRRAHDGRQTGGEATGTGARRRTAAGRTLAPMSAPTATTPAATPGRRLLGGRLVVEPEATDRWRWLGWAAGLGVVVAAVYAVVGIPGVGVPEPQHQLGWVTPTCGLTRGVTSIARGDLAGAWGWNPAAFLVVAVWAAALARAAVGWRTGRWWTPSVRLGRVGWVVALTAVALLWANQQSHAEHIIHGHL